MDCRRSRKVDFNISPDQERWRDLAREFVENHIRPDVLRRDKLPTAKERIPWDWIKEADAAGFRTLGIQKNMGGLKSI